MNHDYHTPVLTDSVVTLLRPSNEGIYVDATLGGGGHAEAILRASAPSGRVIGFDADEEAIEYAQRRLAGYSGRVVYVQKNFSHMNEALATLRIPEVDGILFDLGVSSHQIDSDRRGFSFGHDQPLDMRFDRRTSPDAAIVLNTYDESSLADLFLRFGEERNARRIAKAVVRERAGKEIRTSGQLAGIVESVVGGRFLRKSLARVFQAVRIEVNRELDALRSALSSCPAILRRGGRLIVISYHSLEDRMVKEFIREHSRTSVRSAHKYLPDTPVAAEFTNLTKKPLVARDDEIQSNSRARSAKLRAAERCVHEAR